MASYEADYPGYEFAVHKGYCTPLHQERLEVHGPSHIHRWCFENVRRTARPEGWAGVRWVGSTTTGESSARLLSS